MSTAVATLEPTRLPIPADVAKKYGLSQTQWRVLTDQIFPSAKTAEAVVMAIEYCRARNLDIYKRPIHIVPVWSSVKGKMVETCWPGISEIRTTAARTGQYVGKDETKYGPMIKRTFEGVVDSWENKQKVQKQVSKEVSFPEWGSVVVYRLIGGVPRAFNTKIYWLETYGTLKGTDVPNDMWAKRPIGQFDKCLEAAALRQAFPEEIGNDLVAEEMEGRTFEVAEPATPKPPRPDSATPKPNGTEKLPPKPANDQSELAGKQVEDAQVEDEPSFTQEVEHDPETGEIAEEGEEALVPADPSEHLTRLENALEKAVGALDVEEIWNEMDLSSVFTHLPDAESWIGMAKKIRDRFLNKLKNPKAVK